VQNLFYFNYYGVSGKVIEPVGECRDELEIYAELARRLGAKLQFNMTSAEKHNDYQLKPSGKTFDQLRGKNVISWPIEYKKYEQEGYKFGTETGKVELYSKHFEKFGYDPLPFYEEPAESPYSTPELLEKYPLILISGGRSVLYYHSAFRQIPWLRELFPDPVIEIHPDTAEKLGIHDGDWVWIETSQMEGRVKQKAEVTLGIHPKVVHAPSHWWFPERTGDPERGCMESNINTILSAGEPYDHISGSTVVRGSLCKIYKVEEDKS
jgi:anaerobic selenocysteine-containing dehydrogenase